MNQSLASNMVRDHIAEQHRLTPRSTPTRHRAAMRRRLGLGLIQLGLHVMNPPRPPVLLTSTQFGRRAT
jgi:hypothetical protein